MRTPAGKECTYFFGDYYRGRNIEKCNLIGDEKPPRSWKADLCKTCPVPGILLANGCDKMTLAGEVKPGILGIGRKVNITAYCTKVHSQVENPYIGCGHCHGSVAFTIGDEH
ncbi:MAG TPA: hypothetical protein PK174_00045 [Anaerolineaceae bacterium]|nr:hypothetical protein [Anaerolineaceae bacterium]